MVILRTTTGDMGVLPGHETYFCVLDYGALRMLDGSIEYKIAVFGGIAEIGEDILTIQTSEAQWPEDIDRARSEAIREHLERKIQEKTDDLELLNDQARLRRALVRIEVSGHTSD